MIQRVAVGAGRILLNLAAVALVIALGLAYASYRLTRAAVLDRPEKPVRDASFAALVALTELARSVRDR